MAEKIQARVTHQFSASSETVYDAWLDPLKVTTWMSAALAECGLSGEMKRVEIDARVGGKFFFSDMRDGKEAQHWGTYLELEPCRRIVFTWIVDASEESNPSKVTLDLESNGTGCIATMTHDMDAKWKDYVSRTEAGWARMLRAIESTI